MPAYDEGGEGIALLRDEELGLLLVPDDPLSLFGEPSYALNRLCSWLEEVPIIW